MTLVELLRSDARYIAKIHDAPVEKQVTWAAADRIEALEAVLREIADPEAWTSTPVQIARAALEGKK